MNKENLGKRKVIIDECRGCDKIETQLGLPGFKDSAFCLVYLEPRDGWRKGKCPNATMEEKNGI